MMNENSAMELVRKDILRFVSEAEKPTQEAVIKAMNWPSVLVSFALGTLVEEGRLESHGGDSNPLFSLRTGPFQNKGLTQTAS